MDKKDFYIKLYNCRKEIYGIDIGFKCLNFLLEKLEKNKSEVLDTDNMIYDYRVDNYFSCNIKKEDINMFLQQNYLEFVFKTQILNSDNFIKVYQNLIKKLKTQDSELLQVYSLITKLFFLVLKKMTRYQSVLENNINNSDFLKTIVSVLDKIVLNNSKVNKDMAELIIDIMEEEKVIKKDYVSFSIIDKNYFSCLKYMSADIVDVFSEDIFAIKYSSEYALNNLGIVLINFSENINIDFYNSLLYSIMLSNSSEEEIKKISVFLQDLKSISLFPEFLHTHPKDNNQIALYERIFLNKFLINEYCFSVLAVSCFKNYFFSKKKEDNILLQKSDPRLNLNPDIYDFLIH